MVKKRNIICVLWKGSFLGRCYNEGDVEKLYNSVKKWAGFSFDFYCLTNSKEEIVGEKIKLIHNWPGWWSKVELFRQEMPKGRTLYLDLDSHIVNNLQPIFRYKDDFVTFNTKVPKWKEKRDKGLVCRYQTSTMLYDPSELKWIYNKFKEDPIKWMKKYRSEQDMYGEWIPDQPTFPDEWLVKLESLRKQELSKEAIFVTGHTKDGIFRNPDFINLEKIER